MAWSTDFLAGLSSRTVALRFVLEIIALDDEPRGEWSASTHDGLGADDRIAVGGVSVQGQTLQPVSWSATVGAFSVEIVTSDPRNLFRNVTRGTCLALRAGFAGWRKADFEIIALGQVRTIRGRGVSYTIECYDLYSAARQRLSTTSTVNRLFPTIGSSTTTTAAYAAGDTTLSVSSTTGFERETSGSYGLLITPTSGADPFYLLATSAGASSFTVTAANQMGTTRVAAASGSTVTEVFYLSGHPLDIARKLLISDGGGGTYDVYGTGNGLGIPTAYVDHDDIDRHKLIAAVSSGSYSWEYPVSGPVDDGYSFLADFLAPGGMFLTQRQGLLTARACQATQGSAPYVSGVEITDQDIAEVLDYDAFDPASDIEYTYVSVSLNGGATLSTSTSYGQATLPAERYLRYDLSDRVFGNTTQIATDLKNRLAEAATRIPERLTLRCAGLRLAQLAPEDLVYLTSSRVRTRYAPDGPESYPARVVEVSPSWSGQDGGSVRVTLLLYPQDEEVFPT